LLVLVYALALLALLFFVGLPLALIILGPCDLAVKQSPLPVRLLLSGATGCAVLALIGGWFFAFGWPLETGIRPLWAALGTSLWGWQYLRGRRRPIASIVMSSQTIVPAAVIPAGLAVALAMYLWPFFAQPDLVFWHHAGSDAYFYMRLADYVQNVGTGVTPNVGLYEPNAGFLASVIEQFREPFGNGEKPGTFGLHAAAAALLGVSAQEAFSPLILSGIGLLYVSLILFGDFLGLPLGVGVVFAVLGCVSLPVWLLGTYTFLANVLTLHLFPLLLFLLRPTSPFRITIYIGFMLADLLVLFPDSVLALLIVLVVYMPVVIVIAKRNRTLRQFALRTGSELLIAGLLVTPLFGYLVRTAFGRFNAVVVLPTEVLGLMKLILGPRLVLAQWATPRESEALLAYPIPSWNWLWPAFNLNKLPPEPLRAEQAPFLTLFIACLVAFVAWSPFMPRARSLLAYLGGCLVLIIVGGVAGLLKSDYELFRALSVFGFIPLAAICCVVSLVARMPSGGLRLTAAKFASAIIAVVLLCRFAVNDWEQFRYGMREHLSTAQYTAGDIADRAAIAKLAADHTIVLAADAPDFTTLSNEVMLFSPANVAIPNASFKFFYLGAPNHYPMPPFDAQYASEFVIRDKRLLDISPIEDADAIYQSTSFVVLRNDLIPFFDNDTFTSVYGFPADFLRARSLSPARLLTNATDVMFFSQRVRQVQVRLKVGTESARGKLAVLLDGASYGDLQQSGSTVTLSSVVLRVSTGLHRLTLVPDQGVRVQVADFLLVSGP
jgi:hypothetical protein